MNGLYHYDIYYQLTSFREGVVGVRAHGISLSQASSLVRGSPSGEDTSSSSRFWQQHLKGNNKAYADALECYSTENTYEIECLYEYRMMMMMMMMMIMMMMMCQCITVTQKCAVCSGMMKIGERSRVNTLRTGEADLRF